MNVNVNVTQTPKLKQERRCRKVEIPVGTGDGIRTKGRRLYICNLVDQGRILTKSVFALASVFGLDILVSPLVILTSDDVPALAIKKTRILW